MVALRSLPELAAAISAKLAGSNIRHAVSGAVAMAVHGVVRATKDLDILVVAPQVRLPDVFAIVRDCGFRGEDPVLLRGLREDGYAELASGPVRVEILGAVRPYHRTLPDRAVSVGISGTRVPFVSLEDLVVLKMLWRRPKDIPDIHSLLAASRNFDADYVRSTLASILSDDDPRHAELADWIRRYAPGKWTESAGLTPRSLPPGYPAAPSGALLYPRVTSRAADMKSAVRSRKTRSRTGLRASGGVPGTPEVG